MKYVIKIAILLGLALITTNAMAQSQLLGTWKLQEEYVVSTMILNRQINESQVIGIERSQWENEPCRVTNSVIASVKPDSLVEIKYTVGFIDGDDCGYSANPGRIFIGTYHLSADGNELTHIDDPDIVYIKQ